MAADQVLLDSVSALVDELRSIPGSSDGFSAARDHQLLSLLERVGSVMHQAESIGALLAVEVGGRSEDPDDSLARRAGDRSAQFTIARLARIEVAQAQDWRSAGQVAASRVSLQGDVLPARYPQVSDALRSAELSPRAVCTIVTALDGMALRLTTDDLARVEHLLVDAAPGMGVHDLKQLCQYALDRFDPDGVEPREEAELARRGLEVIRTRDGMQKWILTLDALSAGFLTAALDARVAPRRQPTFSDEPDGDADLADPRTWSQRRLDALVRIAQESLERDDGQVGGTSVTMVVTIPLAALECGLGAGYIEGIDTPISAGTARRLAANANIIPAVLGSKSEPLDLGGSSRLFSEAQRRAMTLRDGGCVMCGAPPGQTEAAHVTAWSLTKQTDLTNGILLCAPDHRRFDKDGWQLEWKDGTPWLIPPAWIDPTRTPRRGRQARQLTLA